jgi:putative DNA primase/helicase
MLNEVDRARDSIDRVVGSVVQTPALSAYELLSSADLAALQPHRWLVRGVLPERGLAAMFGPSGSGKSFLQLDLCLALAEGAPWFGHWTKPAFVVYAALEGEAGIRQRVQAWETHNARTMPDNMRFLLQPFRLTTPQDIKDLASTFLAFAGAGGVLVLDTLNRAAPTSDENSSQDMGVILEAMKRLQGAIDGLVVVVHHTGKDSSRGLRGHSSLLAALDVVIEVTRDGDRRQWSLAKSKDGEDGEGKVFRLTTVDLGMDDENDRITSCVVTSDTASQEIRRVQLPRGGNQKIVLDALRPHFKVGRLATAGAPPLKPCIELAQAVIEAAHRLTCDADRRPERARAAIEGLVSRGVLGVHDGWLWLV